MNNFYKLACLRKLKLNTNLTLGTFIDLNMSTTNNYD